MNRTLRDTLYLVGVIVGGMLLVFGAVLAVAAVWWTP